MIGSFKIPLVKSITPSGVQAGDNEKSLIIEGERIDGITDMLFLGGGITILGFEKTAPGRIQVSVSVDKFAPAGHRYLMVVDPDAGIGVARPQLYVEPCPEITLVRPSRLARGSSGARLWLTGGAFSPGETAVVSGSGVRVVDTEWVAPDTVEVVVDVDNDAPLGRRDICVAGDKVSGRTRTALEIIDPDDGEEHSLDSEFFELNRGGVPANPYDGF